MSTNMPADNECLYQIIELRPLLHYPVALFPPYNQQQREGSDDGIPHKVFPGNASVY